MRTIPSGLQTHLEGEMLTLATLVKITRTDGEVFGFTNHDRDITVGGVTYGASTAAFPSQISGTMGLTVDNLNIEGSLDSSAITEIDIEKGLWDFAEIEVLQCNWANTSNGTVTLRRGEFGRITRRGLSYVAEMLGLMVRLQRTVGRILVPTCDVKRLGDARCGVGLSDFTFTGTVSAVTSRSVFTVTGDIAGEATGYFRRGTIEFTSSVNLQGLSFNLSDYTSPGILTLDLEAPLDISVGDTVTAVAGCDRTFETCRVKFDNVINFRGFPHVPGRDKLIGEPVQ